MERDPMAWDDLRVLLAVARAGSLTKAARRLGVDPATVSRRVAALEKAVAGSILRSVRGRRVPTEAGARLVAIAEEVERGLLAARRDVIAEADGPHGVVRVSAVDVLATHVIAPALDEMNALYPGVVLELLVTPAVLDLARGDADIALRLVQPDEPGLRRKRVARMTTSLYARRDRLATWGIDPEAPGDGRSLPIIEYTSALIAVPENDHLRAALPAARSVLRTTSVGSVLVAVQRGHAAGLIPDAIAAGDSTLARIAVPAGLRRDLWLAVHPDAARLPRVRAAIEMLERAFARLGAGDPDAER